MIPSAFTPDTRFTMPFSRRMVLFVCFFLLCFVIGSVLTAVIMAVGKGSVPSLRIATVVQDILIFVVPAIATAVMITRRPDWFLNVGKAPGAAMSLLVVCVMIVSVPAMNVVVEWNQNIHLPESLGVLEKAMRDAEISAQTAIGQLIGGSSVMSCVLGVLIVGLLAGFSEELFFRGTLQRLLVTKPVNAHVAIWVTAIIFSAVHFQFFGFVPRMLLGALFGYIAWWTGNLWLPVIAHAVNNSMVVIVTWMMANGILSSDPNTIGTTDSVSDLIFAGVSLTLTAVGICLIRHISQKNALKYVD